MKFQSLTGTMLASVLALGLATVGCGSDSNGGGTGGAGARDGGVTGTGGGGGGGGGAGGTVNLKINYTFDTTVQGFALNTYCEMANLGGVPTSDAGAQPCTVPASPPTVTLEPADGSPSPGSLKVTVTFSDFNQYADVIINPTMPVDLTGRTLRAKAKLVSATGGTFTGGAQLHASTGATYVYGNPLGTSFATEGTWQDFAFPLNTVTAAGWDPSMVVQIGMQFYSGMPITGGPTTLATPLTVVFEIDTITG